MKSPDTGFVCQNCGSRTAEVKYDFSVRKILECKACELMVVDPMPSASELNEIYNQNYFQNKGLTLADVSGVYGYFDYISERVNKQSAYKKICRKLKFYGIDDTGELKLLDFGCGLGFFLDAAYDFGYSVHGVEFNPSAIEYIKGRYTYDVSPFKDYNEYGFKFDVIAMFDVIEHLKDPFHALGCMHDNLKDNGLLVISTMDSKGLVSRILGRKLEDFRRIQEHIYFFSKKNLVQVLLKNGFEILEIRSLGHSFELGQLIDRVRNVVPVLGIPMQFIVKYLKFLRNINIYFNPYTKFIVYARKKGVKKSLSEKLLSIIIPVFNEELFIERVIQNVCAAEINMGKEIIVVNDGSTDNTAGILEKYSGGNEIRIIHKHHEGKGAAVTAGIRASKGDYVIIQDSDLEYNPEDIPLLLEAVVKTNADVVYGTRFGGRYRKTGYFFNTLANKFLTLLTNLVNGLNLTDMETGYKLFNGPLIRSIRLNSKNFDFEAEVTCKIARLKIPIYEVPVSYDARSYFEGKKIRFSDGRQAIATIFKYGLFRLD